MILFRNPQNGLLDGTQMSALVDAWQYNGFAEPIDYRAQFLGDDLLHVAYARDKLGRITQKVETIGANATTTIYGYDLAGRLDTVTENGTLIADYAYDSNSNKVGAALAANGIASSGCAAGMSNPSATVDAQDRLLTYANCTYTYTANGELTGKTNINTGQTTTYDYDVFANLRSATLPNGDVLSYQIDGRNRRIGKWVNGVKVQGFVYMNQLEPVAETDGAGERVATFIYADRSNVPSYLLKGGNTYRVIADHLGSVRLVVDVADGTVAQRMDYDAWGNVINDTNPGFQPFGYAGGLYDRDLKLVRFGARDYDPESGRWTGKDPIRFHGGDGNLFVYVSSDPINETDPTGLRPLTNCEKSLLSPYIPEEDLGSADVHDGKVPRYLPDDQDAITRGEDIYIRPDVFAAGTPEGVALLGHELVHVGQYRAGMNWIKYLWSVRKDRSRNSKYEKPAYELEDRIIMDLEGKDCTCGGL